MPAVQDIRRALPQAQIDWVVEPSFAPLVQRCEGVRRVIPCAIRLWRKSWWRAGTRAAWQAFQNTLGQVQYDAVIDCQGLTKSAIVARCAALSATGKRYAMANRTAGSGYEAPTRWVADVAITLPQQVHAVERSRMLCAQALGYTLSDAAWSFGLDRQVLSGSTGIQNIVFVHGSSREDKCWPMDHWVQLAQQLQAQGFHIALVHGSDAEQQRSQAMADAIGGAVKVWPRAALDELTTSLAHCAGVIGVDSGVSHIAVALNVPHVQLYNFDTAWRTGPVNLARQTSVFAAPHPSVAQVWAAWQQVRHALHAD